MNLLGKNLQILKICSLMKNIFLFIIMLLMTILKLLT